MHAERYRGELRVPEDAVDAALSALTGKALFLKPEEMRAALEAGLPVALERRGFNDLVAARAQLLDTKYPADVFTGESGESGPGFVAKVREALAVLDGESS